MAKHARLPNYLRAYRKHSGFSQREIAFLMGTTSGAKVSHYERFMREPTLQTALICEIIFDIPVRELFAGAFERAERDTRRRAHLLALRLKRKHDDLRFDRKLAAITIITRRSVDDLFYEHIDPGR